MTIAHRITTASACRSLAPVLEPDTSLAPVLVAVAPISSRDVTSLGEAAVAAGLTLVVASSHDELSARLGVRPPRAVVFEAGHPDARKLCGAVRGNPMTSSVALFALSDAPATVFASALAWGASEVVERASLAELRRSLRMLHGVPLTIAKPKGRAVIAHRNDEARSVIASALASAGFAVELVADGPALRRAIASSAPALIVCGAESSVDPFVDELAHVRAGGSLVPWILSLPRPAIRGARALLESLPYVAVHDASTPPDGVLFLANEISNGGYADARVTARVLHAAPIRIRGGGLELASYTYNVSEGGLFARTLMPLTIGLEVELELDAPLTAHTVRLDAKVTWQRPFGPLGGAVSPPGVGFALTGDTTPDRAVYAAACASLASDVAPVASGNGRTLKPWPVAAPTR